MAGPTPADARRRAAGLPVSRGIRSTAGTGVVVEFDPARLAGGPGTAAPGFKRFKKLTALGELVDRLQRTAPWLELAGYETDCRSSDRALDAVVAALTARAAAQGLFAVPGLDQLDAARHEGWIALPTSSTSNLHEECRTFAAAAARSRLPDAPSRRT